MAEPVTTTMPRPASERRQPPPPEFPGCRPMRIPRDQIADCDIRFEYWDADTEIAMLCEPVSYYHERPAGRLARLAGLIAAARGAPIEAVGHTDLLVRNARGERQRIMQADQILFLRPAQTIPRGKVIEVGDDSLPDVVLEVDNTTDVRRGKLGLYEAWGFPEVWVEVPDEPDESRPASARLGLTIHLREAHLREAGRLRPALVSRALPGWTADEIHRALNEPELSEETTAALRRVGRSLGATEGTGPDDDPFLREERRESHAAGRSQGRTEAQRANALKVLEARGVPVSASLAEQLAQMEGAGERLVDAALACRDEEEFLRLVSART
ncbi:MAG: Uma2 family endonuclease [Spirochaetaceae bacterium]|nr:Uma2 family endonuclease [Spirochaetaceae bacterium]